MEFFKKYDSKYSYRYNHSIPKFLVFSHDKDRRFLVYTQTPVMFWDKFSELNFVILKTVSVTNFTFTMISHLLKMS